MKVSELWDASWASSALGGLTILVLVVVVHAVAFAIVRRVVVPASWRDEPAFRRGVRWSTLLATLALAAQLVLPGLVDATDAAADTIRHAMGLLVVAAVTWLGVAVIGVVSHVMRVTHDTNVEDNLEARRVHTQVTLLARSLSVLVVVIGVAVALTTFPRIRELGTSILVSAGFAGLAVGLAARPVLENLIAGLQLAFTQPIRLDDVVIVEGEWGRVEEILSTYVVVRIWDERRLVVPLSRFISQPFQNWTRTSAELIGTVFLYSDYTVDVDAIRAELERICKGHPKWDGRVCVLQVTGATERTVELRALVSARNSGEAWDLRVDVRERLLDFLQRTAPDALPRTRVSLTEPAGSEQTRTA